MQNKQKQAQNRAKVADGWAGAAIHYYKTTAQEYFMITYLTSAFKTKQRKEKATLQECDG